MSESWEVAQNLQGGAVLCQDLQELGMETQMSIYSDLCMIFELGLAQIQVGGEIPIGSHCNMV